MQGEVDQNVFLRKVMVKKIKSHPSKKNGGLEILLVKNDKNENFPIRQKWRENWWKLIF